MYYFLKDLLSSENKNILTKAYNILDTIYLGSQ